MKLTGKRAYFWQTLSAGYLAIFTPYLVWISLTYSVQSPEDLFTPALLIPTLFAVVLVFIHAWVGLRDIIIDYFPRHALRWALPSLLILLSAIALQLLLLLTLGLNR